MLEYCNGSDLQTLMRNGLSLRKESTLRFVYEQVLLAMRELYRRGIVHRDIKNSNILVDFDLLEE